LTKAFDVMDPDKTGRISKEQIFAVFYILNEDFPEIRRLDKDEENLIFGFLDKDGSSTITVDEFLDFGNVLLLEFTKESDYETIMQRFLPKLYHSCGWQAVCTFVQSTVFEYSIDLILLLNAVIIAIQSYPELSGKDITMDPHYNDGYIDTIWELMETAFTMVYVLEVVVKILVDGWKKYSESPRNMFDFSITMLAVFATAYVYCEFRTGGCLTDFVCVCVCVCVETNPFSFLCCRPDPNAYSDSRLIRFIVMARVLRLARLLFAYKAFELIGIVSCDIIPAAVYVILMLLFLMYAFSSLGVILYGGSESRSERNSFDCLAAFPHIFAHGHSDYEGPKESSFIRIVASQ
jgi:two pore calcium channel protein